jgi:hypothetical protein
MEPSLHRLPISGRSRERWRPGRILAVAAVAAGAVAIVAIAVTRATTSSHGGGGGHRLATTSIGVPGGGCRPPYSSSSPWNTPIPRGASVPSDSRRLVATINQPLTSDPTQFTYPVYVASPKRPQRSVRVDGRMSLVVAPNRLHGITGFTARIRIPGFAQPSPGGDDQVIVLDPHSGSEWGFWEFSNAHGRMTATNGYRYDTKWNGVAPRGFGSRGAGMTYLAGLVRPCEIAQGHIDHALAFVYHYTTSQFVYPARKSDGHAPAGQGLPEGARLQLDPSLSAAKLRSWGCHGACLTIAHALQRYGMFVVDTGGHPKLTVEAEETAHWHGRITASTVSPIRVSAFRIVR